MVSLQGVACSLQGGRPENQDDWGFMDTPLGFLLVVCDGMGGGPGGKTASYIVKNVLMAALQECNTQTSRMTAMKMAVSRANDALYQKMDEVPELRGMGSTLVALLVNQQSALVAHLGDSRCYRMSHGRIVFRTDDHSLVGELVRNKALTEEQARTSPQSNVIMRALGNTSNHVAEITEIPYRKGDRFFLCTDGVWGIMPHEQLTNRLTSYQTLQALVGNLSAEIDQIGFSSNGHHDNHTLAAIEIHADSILKDKMSKRIKLILFGLGALLTFSLLLNIVAFTKSKYGADAQTLAALESKNRELESKMELYRNIKDNNTRKWITQVEVLEYEKELLNERQEELIGKVDSLERVLSEREGRGTTSASAAKPSSTATPQEIVQKVTELFVSMEKAKAGTSQEAVKIKASYRQQIVEQLLTLDKRTNGRFSPTIESINRELRSSIPLTDEVWRNEANKTKEEYVSTKRARQMIQKLAGRVKEIGRQLSK